jgi:fatty acid synthase
MSAFMRNVAYHGVQLDILMKSGSEDEVTRVMSLLKDGIEKGTVRPLDTTVFDKDSAADAFRYMSEGKHFGKVVLKIRSEESQPVATAPAVSVKAVGRTFFDSHKSYIVVGGLGGVGLEVITWMAERGARLFVLTARSGVTTVTQIIIVIMIIIDLSLVH